MSVCDPVLRDEGRNLEYTFRNSATERFFNMLNQVVKNKRYTVCVSEESIRVQQAGNLKPNQTIKLILYHRSFEKYCSKPQECLLLQKGRRGGKVVESLVSAKYFIT